MADRVDAAVDAVQALGPHPLRDSVFAYAEAPQLRAGHHAELPRGQRGQAGLQLGLVAFCTHLDMESAPHRAFAPSPALG